MTGNIPCEESKTESRRVCKISYLVAIAAVLCFAIVLAWAQLGTGWDSVDNVESDIDDSFHGSYSSSSDTVAQVSSSTHESGPHKRPNILLFFPDQWRFDWMPETVDGFSYNRSNVQLPNLRYMMQHGINFKHAAVQSPLCGPSRACLVTGRDYFHSEILKNSQNIPEDAPTFYQLLRNSGYHVMSAGKDDLTMHEHNPGVPQEPSVSNGFNHTQQYRAWQLGFSDAIRTLGKKAASPGIYGKSTEYVPEATLDEPYGKFLVQTSPDPSNPEYYVNTMHCLHGDLTGYNQCPEGIDTPNKEFLDRFNQDSAISLFHNYLRQYTKYNQKHDNNIKANVQSKTKKPWYMQINFAGPHHPYLVTKDMMQQDEESRPDTWWFAPPIGMDSEYMKHDPENLKNTSNSMGKKMSRSEIYKNYDDIRWIMRGYGIQMEMLDSFLGEWIELLKSVDQFENTIICMSSDHGDMMHDYSLKMKEKPWSASLLVPLTCMHGGETLIKPGSQVIDTPVALMDLFGTFLDLADVEKVPPMQYESFRNILKQGTKLKQDDYKREHVTSGIRHWRLVLKETKSIQSKIQQNTSNSQVQAAQTSLYKYICCKRSCDGVRKVDGEEVPKTYYQKKIKMQHYLFDVTNDIYDQNNLVEHVSPQFLKQFQELLPPGYCNMQ